MKKQLKKISVEINKKWECVDCKKDCFRDPKDYYMLKNEIWKVYGVGKGMLCIHCIETRLGRSLTKNDLVDFPINTVMNPYTANILKSS